MQAGQGEQMVSTIRRGRSDQAGGTGMTERSEREKIIAEAMRDFITNLPDDECFSVDIKMDKQSKFRSFCVKRKGASP